MMFLFLWGHAIPRMIENNFVLLIADWNEQRSNCLIRWFFTKTGARVHHWLQSLSLRTASGPLVEHWQISRSGSDTDCDLQATFHLLSTTEIRCFRNHRITSHPFHDRTNHFDQSWSWVIQIEELLSITIMITFKFASTMETPRRPGIFLGIFIHKHEVCNHMICLFAGCQEAVGSNLWVWVCPQMVSQIHDNFNGCISLVALQKSCKNRWADHFMPVGWLFTHKIFSVATLFADGCRGICSPSTAAPGLGSRHILA